MNLTIYTDGASKGNPGVGFALAHITVDNEDHYEVIKLLGPDVTNNQAEYEGMILAFLNVFKLKQERFPSIMNTTIYTDSQLLEGQLTKGWKINKNKGLVVYCKDLLKKTKNISSVSIKWVRREENKAGIRLEELL